MICEVPPVLNQQLETVGRLQPYILAINKSLIDCCQHVNS